MNEKIAVNLQMKKMLADLATAEIGETASVCK